VIGQQVETVQESQEQAGKGKVVAFVGLAIQTILVIAMATLAAWTGSGSLTAATWHMLGGIPIWIILILVFGQQEIERREALAAEKLATGETAVAVLFGELSDELQRARQRLSMLVAYGLPSASMLVGGYLVGMGAILLWRFLGTPESPAAGFGEGTQPVGMVFASGGIAFVAFIAGRWMSGCARTSAWQLLRGGASYLMSCAVVAGGVLAASSVAAFTEEGRVLELLAVVVPVFMVVIGSEILLVSLLEAYRPRRPGEIPRPAFDSRLLGLLTAPGTLGEVVSELIRYQFGVEVSGSWLYRLLGRSLTPLTLFGGVVLLALSCLVVVGPDEEGIVLRFGRIEGQALPPGIHVKLPWPIETEQTYPTRRVLQLSVSSNLGLREHPDAPILWTRGDDRLDRIGVEYYPTGLVADGGIRGLAVLDAEVVLQYTVHDLVPFLERAPEPEATLAVLAQQETSRYFAGHDVQFLMSRGRTEAGPVLARAIQDRVDALGLGLRIVDASMTSLQPPGGSVARAFHRQIAAQQDRETLMERAKRDAVATLSKVAGSVALSEQLDEAIVALDALRTRVATTEQADTEAATKIAALEASIERLLGEARGEAAELIHAARGDRWTRIVADQTAIERFGGDLLAHEQAPRYYRASRLLDVIAAAMADRRKFVIAGDPGKLPVLRMDFADPASAIDTLLGE
jgi:membrane protease subunit HflK